MTGGVGNTCELKSRRLLWAAGLPEVGLGSGLCQ